MKRILFIALLLLSSISLAEKVSCPSVSIIQHATLTKIDLKHGTYFAKGNFHLLGRDWKIHMSFGNQTFQSNPSLSDAESYLKKVSLRVDYEDVACNYWYFCEHKYSCEYAGEGVLITATT